MRMAVWPRDGSARRAIKRRNKGTNALGAAKSAGGEKTGKTWEGRLAREGSTTPKKAESPRNGGLSLSLPVATSFATTAQRNTERATYPLTRRRLKPYAKFFAAKSQFTMFQ
jgi:hypothetical protein